MDEASVNEARILLECAVIALESDSPNIEAAREMLAQADELLAQAGA